MSHYRKSSSYGKRSSSYKTEKHTGVTSRKLSGAMKIIAVLAAFLVVGIGAFSIISALTKTAKRNAVDLEYGSVMSEIADGEKFSIDRFNGYASDPNGADNAENFAYPAAPLAAGEQNGYTAVEIFARLNWRFAQQTQWYGEYHGKVNTVVEQDVQTYKYYRDGMLLSADLTTSSLVSGASQFCYLKDQDRVLWRKPVGGASTYNGMDTAWKTGEPYRNMTISGADGFKAQNGLPAYELSVYVIEGKTVLSAEVEELEDGRFKVTFVMNPNNWTEKDADGNEIVKGANAYYVNQMIFTGGLPEAPEFSALTVAFTFDENWFTYKSEVTEEYSAAYGPIKAPCKAWGGTEYDYAAYGENREYPTAYEDYFCNWADAEVDRNPIQKEITPVNCLADAFGGLLAEPSALSLDLTVNGEKRSAVALLDLSKTDLSDFDLNALEARVGLGALSLWIEDGKVYLKYGNLKASLQLEEFVGFFAPDPGEETGGGLDTDALLAALGEGQFLVTDTAAELHSVLPLLGLEIPVDFYFKVDEEQNITLDRAEARIEVGGQTIGAVIRMGGRPISALTEAEKANYPVLNPYVAGLKELFTSNRYRIEIGYTGKDVAVSGAVEIAASPLAVQGAITVSLPASEVSKTLRIMYRDGSVYLDLDGIRIKADVAEAVELIKQYVSLSELTDGLSLDLGKLFSAVLSEKFAANLISEEKDSAFRILVRGTELLGALGLEYELGDVSVSATAKSLSLEALGARITLTEGREFTPDPTDGYTDLLPYAAQIAELVAGGFLHADLSYTSDTISVTGGLDLDLHSLAAAAQISVSYAGAVKQFGAVYSDGMLYLTVDGLRVKADVKGAIGIVGEFVDLSAGDRDALGIISDLLSLDFSEFITLGEDKDTLHVAVAGTQLLQALGLGLDLDPGTVELLVGGGKIGVKLMNATVEIAKGNSFTYSTDGYAEIVPYAEKLLAIYRGGYLHADLSYEIAGLALKGEADLDFNTLNVQAALTLSYKNASKEIDILYTQGDILLGVDNLRLAVNAEEAMALLSDALGLEGSGLETEALLSALFGMNFSELIPELWESDGTLHIAVSSGKLLGLFGVKFDLGDLRLALGEDGVTVKLGAAAIALSAGKAFTPETGDYLDVTDYAKAVLSLVKSEAMKIGVSYAGEKLSVSGELVAVPAAKSAKGDFTLTYDGTEHKLGIFILPEKDLYLDLDGIKVRANLNDALTLVKSLLSKEKNAAEPMALDLTEEEADLLERILSFDIATLFSLTETEDTLTLIVQADKILSVLGLGFEIGEAQIDLQKTGKIGVTLLGGDLSASVEGGEAIEIGVPEGYVDVIVYVQYLLDLFDQRTVDVRLGYDGENLDLRGSVSIDTETRVLKGELTLVYKGSVRAASFFYREKVLYLEMGDYKLKADTTAALVMLASYLGFSETEGADYETLAKVFSFDFEGLVSLSENESRDMLTVLIKGNELLAQLGLDLDLGNVAVQLGKGYLHAEVKGATVEAAGSSMPVVVPEFEGYIDVTDYVDVLSGIFKQSALQIAIGYEKDGTKIDGNVFLDIHGKRVSADLRVAANGESFTLGLAYLRENGAPVLYLDLDGAKIKLDVDQLVSLLRGEPEKISTFSAIALESVPQTTALSAETKNKLADLLDKLLSLNLDSYFSLDLSEDGNALTLVAKGTELIEKLFGTVEIFGKEIKLGNIRFTVSKGQNGEKDRIDLSALGATLKLTGISAEEYPALSDPESYADAAVYLGYLKELFANDVLRLTIEDLTFALGGKEIGISGAIDLAKDLSVVGGNLTLTLGEKAIALSLYYEKAEKIVYFGVGGVKIRASVEEIKALVERIKNFGKDQTAGIALASLSFGLFGVAEGDGVLDLTLDGAGLLKLLGVDFDLGDVSLSVKKGSLGVDITGGKFGLKAALTAGDTVAFEADKSSYIAILDYVNYALDLFEKPALNVEISYRGEALTVLGDVTFDLKNKTAEGTLALSHGETRKQVGFVYLDGTMYIDLGEKFKFKAKTTSAALMLAAYLGFSGKDDLPAQEIEDLFGDLFESFDSLVSLKEGDGALDILIDGTALLEKLGMKLGNFKLGDIGVEIKEGGLVLGLLGAQIVLTGGETVDIPGEEELAGYTDLSKYVDTVADIFKSGYLDLSVSYSDNAKDELTVTGHLRLAVKEKAARADLTVARGTTKIRIGVVYEEGMLYLDLDGAKLKVDPARAVEFIRGLLAKDAEPAAIAQISMPAVMALDEPAPIGLSAAQKEKLADLLETLFTLELDRFFTVTEEGDALSVVVAGTELLRKLTGKDLDLGSVKIEVTASTYTDQGEIDACGTLTLTALGATLKLTGISAEEYPALSDPESYADAAVYLGYLKELFANDVLRLTIEDLTFALGGKEIGISGAIDLAKDLSVVGGNLTLTLGEKAIALSLYYEKAEKIVYFGVGGVKIRASVEEIKALVERIKNFGKDQTAGIALASLSFGLFGVAEGDGVLDLTLDGAGLLKLLGVDFDLGDVSLSVKKGSLGVDITGGKFGLKAALTAGDTVAFEADKSSYIAILDYVNYALDLFEKPALNVEISYRGEALTVLGDVTFDLKNKTAEGTLALSHGETRKQVGFVYLDGTMYIDLGEKFKFKAKTTSAALMLAAYLGFSGKDDLPAQEIEDLFGDLFESFDSLVSLKEGDGALDILIDGTALLEKLGMKLGNFKLGDIGVEIKEGGLVLGLLGAQIVLTGGETVDIPGEEELAGYTDLSKYVDTVADIFKSGYLDLSVSYSDNAKDELTVTGHLRLAVKEKAARADLTVARGTTKIRIGVVYEEGMLYLDLDGAKLKVDPARAVEFIRGLLAKDAEPAAIAQISMPAVMALDEPAPIGLSAAQKEKLADLLETLFTLELDRFFTVTEEGDALSVVVAGTELLRKLTGKDLDLGSVKIEVTASTYTDQGEIDACGTLTLTALGATIAFTDGEAFEPLGDAEKAEYADIMQYVEWAADIFAAEAKRIDVTLSAGDLTVKLGLDTVESGAFLKGTIRLSYRSAADKTFVFVYNKEDGYLYLDLDNILVKAKTEDIVQLFKSLFASLSGKEANGNERIALGYAAAIIAEADELSFGVFSLQLADGALGLAVSGDAIMSLLGEKVQSLLGEKLSLEEISVTVSEQKFSVGADLTAGGKAISLGADVSKGTMFSLSEEETRALAEYIDVFKYGRMVKSLFTDFTTLQADVTATVGGRDLSVTLKFNRDFTMAQGTLSIGSLHLDLVYALESRKDAEGNDVLLYVKIGENIKLMANVSEAIRLIKSAMPAAIALTAEEMNTLERLLNLNFGEIVKLKETVSESGDALQVTLASTQLFEALGIDLRLGQVDLVIEDGQITLRLPDKGNVNVAIYGTSRGASIEKPADYKDITPIVARLCELIEARAIEFSGSLAFGETSVNIEQGIVTWKEGEDRKFYLKGSLGDFVLELLIEGDHAKLKIGNFGIEFGFSEIDDLINAVKDLVERVKSTMSNVKANVTGTASKQELIGSLQGVVDVLNKLIDILKGSEETAGAVLVAKNAYETGGLQLAPSALKPEEPEKELILNLLLGKVTIGIYDETNYENRGFLGLGIAIGDASKPSVKADFNTAVYYDEIPTLTGEFYRLMDFVELLGYAGDAIALVAEPNLTAKVGGTVLSTNLAMYPNDGLIYQISGDMEYRSGGTFPIRLDMDQNVVEVSADLFVHFKLLIEAGTQKTMVNDVLTDTTPKNIYLDIFITDCDLSGEQNGELDFFVTISEVGEGNVGYDPLKLYAPAKEILTILSGAASILGLDSVTYLNEYLIAPLLDGDMVARFRGLGASLVPTILDLLIKDEDPAENVGKIANGIEIPAEAFGLKFGDVQLRFSSEQDGDASFLAALGVTTSKEEAEGEKTYTKTTDLAFRFSRVDSGEKKPADLTGFFDIEGVDELLIALGRTATHLATEDEVIAGIAQEGEYVRNDVFFIDGKLHLDLSIIGINLETIEINVEGLTVNFDAHNKISLNAKLSYQGVHNALAGLVGSSDIILGDTTLDLTIKGDMMYLRRTQKTRFDGSTEKDLTVPEVIYRAFPLKNFMKDTATMMNHLCFMFNLSEALVTRIMELVGTGGSTPAEKPTDLGGLLDRYITSCTYTPQAPTDGLANLIYTLVLNGAGLTNSDSFGDISVILGVQKGVLRSIEIPTFSIASVVKINASLALRNPEYVFDDGSYDTTESIADILEQAMANKLKSVDWLATAYLEGQLANVTYVLGGEEIGHQQIVFDPTTKELYANFSYPSIKNFLDKNPQFAQDGYTYEWERYDPANFKSEMTLYARPKANVYDLIFIIEQADAEKYGATAEQLAAAGYTWDASRNAYIKLFRWTYDPENYIELPYVTTAAGRIIGFLCPNGNLHNEDHRGLDFYDQSTVEYKAKWNYIDYTVTFDLDNGQPSVKQTGHYGDAVNYPDAPTREGYTFAGWDKTLSEIKGNETVKATWTPCTYKVKLVSEYPITWTGLKFVEEDGRFVATIMFTYDSDVELPKNIEYNSDTAGAVILKGFMKDGVLYSEYLPNVTDEATFTAVWDERGFKIEFTDESGNVYATRYKRAGESFTQSELPDLGKLRRNGYTAQWAIDIDSFKASEDCTISVKYTGITYYIHEYSLKRVNGFEEIKGDFDSEGIQGTSYWRKTYAYVYGGTPHPLTLGVSEDVRGFDFDGYYTERFGQGTKIDPAVINDEMIEKIFNFRVGDSENFYEQNVLFANWIDNSVEVHLYSDFDFTGRTGHDIDGYYKSVKKMEGDYDISEETLSLIGRSDLRRLGWWYQDDAGNWSAIVDVERFRNTDLKTQATVKIFAMWIEDIDITITSFSTSSLLGGAQYNIGGTLTGGLPSGVNSANIYGAVKMAPTTTGYYVLFNKDGSTSDTPGGKRDITVTRDPESNVGTFQQTGMNSGTFGAFVWTERASYGGVIMRMEFTYGSDSIVFYGGNVVSMETFTVTYHKEGGEVVGQVEGVRTGYTGKYNLSAFSDWGVTAADLAFDNRTYADELAAANNIACPQDGSRQNEGVYEWPHRAITGNADIYPSFVLDPVTVVFTSNFKFSNAWRASVDGKTFTYTTKMRPNSTIEFIANGVVFQSYTVAEGKQSQTFAVPTDLPLAAEVRKGYWTEESAVIGEYGATFIVQYSPDTIVYYSELGFNVTAGGGTYGLDAKTEYSFEYSSEHTLIVPDNNATTIDGVTYRFLGWYTKVNGVWSKLGDTISITASEEPTYAYALWMSEFTVTVTQATAKYNWNVSYDYTIAASVSGGELVGAFANEGVSVKTTYRFYANNNAEYEAGTSNGGHTYNDYRTSDSVSFNIRNIAGQNKKQGHAVVTVEYTYQGITISTGEVHAVKSI